MTETFGCRMHTFRLDARRSLADVGRAMGVTPAYLSDMERGARLPSPTLGRLTDWFDALAVPVEERPGLTLLALAERNPGYAAFLIALS